MNQNSYRMLAISLAVALIATIGIIIFDQFVTKPTATNNVNNTVISTNTNQAPIQFVSAKSTQGKSVFESTQFKFTITTDSQFGFSVGSARGYDLIEAGFSKLNPNTSEKKNRDTPNGFNTAADDSIILQIYNNRDGLHGDDVEAFRLWLPVRSSGLQDVKIILTTIAGNNVIKTVEADGIGSFGQYYYFFSPEYIYVFGSDDFTDAQMRDFLAGLSIQK